MNIIICSDNDISEVGQKAAEDAAQAVNGYVALPPQQGTDFNDLHQSQGLEVVRQQIEAATFVKPVSIFTDIAEALANPVEPSFLIDDVMEEKTTGAVFGESTAGKTFIAVDIACCTATENPWGGHEILNPGAVFYFAGEGRQGIPRRVAAWQEYHERTVPPGRLFLPNQRIEFDSAGARLVAEAVESLAEMHGKPSLIVIDTLARSLPAGSDENSAKDMMAFINEVDGLRDRFGCVALIVHHTGHGEDSRNRARGSSTFRAAMDFEILVDKRKNLLRFTKMKDAELPPSLPFELESVGQSAVAKYGEPVREAQGPKLNRTEKMALATLKETTDRLGRHWATIDEWRVDFYRRHHADDLSTKRKAFNRARKDLVEKGALLLDSDTYSIAGQTGQNETMSRSVSGQTGHTPLGGVQCPAQSNVSMEF